MDHPSLEVGEGVAAHHPCREVVGEGELHPAVGVEGVPLQGVGVGAGHRHLEKVGVEVGEVQHPLLGDVDA